jgi:hypothetical protein
VELPTTIGTLLGDESIIEESFKDKEDKKAGAKGVAYSFAEAVELMRFPRPEPGAKKGQ